MSNPRTPLTQIGELLGIGDLAEYILHDLNPEYPALSLRISDLNREVVYQSLLEMVLQALEGARIINQPTSPLRLAIGPAVEACRAYNILYGTLGRRGTLGLPEKHFSEMIWPYQLALTNFLERPADKTDENEVKILTEFLEGLLGFLVWATAMIQEGSDPFDRK